MTAADASRIDTGRLRAVASSTIGLGDQIYESIGEAIVEGRLAPGERLNDKDLAEELGISRTPVREALQRLGWAGLVEMAPSRFTRVTAVTADHVASTLEYLGLQGGIALRLALRRMDAAQLDEAVLLLDRVVDASDREDTKGVLRATRLFVEYLAEHSGNAVFTRTMRQSALLIERDLRHGVVILGSPELRSNSYRRLRAAMQERDADAAERWFRAQHDALTFP